MFKKISSAESEKLLANFEENERLAGIYYAYHALHRYLEEPFTSYMPEALFNISRYLMTETATKRPKGISQLYIDIFIALSKKKTNCQLLVPFYIVWRSRLANWVLIN